MSTGRLIIATGDLQTQQVIACNAIVTTLRTERALRIIFNHQSFQACQMLHGFLNFHFLHTVIAVNVTFGLVMFISSVGKWARTKH